MSSLVAASSTGVHNELTYWGSIYISGIPLIRALFWNIAAFGMLTVLAAPFVPH
jgi:uncharacterized MAPEG superfamily protein